jgi:hypothetical protein
VVRTNVEDPVLCANGTTTSTGKLDIDVTFKGVSQAGAKTLLSFSEVSESEQAELTSGPVPGATLIGSQTGGVGSNAFTAFGLSVECPGSTYTGHEYNKTPHALVPNAVTTVTFTPDYENCSTTSGYPATVDMNGCDYVLHLEKTTPVGNKEATYGVSTNVICPAGQSITITLFTNGGKHSENKPFCKLDIKEQSVKGAHVKDTVNGHIDITGTFEGIHVLRTNVEDPTLCENNTTTTTGKLDIDLTVEGVNEIGLRTELSLSEIAGEIAELTSKAFEGVTLIGSQTAEGSNALTALGISLECPTSTYTGHKFSETPHRLVPNAATTVTVTPYYINCVTNGFPTTVDMNGCDYVVHLGETAPAGNKEGTYAVTTDIVCPAEQSITITMFTNAAKHTENKPFCKLDIKEQISLKGAHAKDAGKGDITITGTFEGIHVLRTNVEDPTLCENNTTTTTGKIDIDLTVKGVNEVEEPRAISISE